MSEEELSDRMILIINEYKECLDYNCNQTEERQREIKYDIETLETMIDLYNKEKEKNKALKEKAKNTMGLIGANYIHKDKVKEKIKELDKKMAEDEVDEFGIHSQGWAALDWTRDFLLELLEE